MSDETQIRDERVRTLADGSTIPTLGLAHRDPVAEAEHSLRRLGVDQVLVRWCLQRQTIVLPKSTHRERLEENAGVFDFALSDADMAVLDGLDHTGGTDSAREQKWW